jgi:hypothetical protein
MKFGSESTPNRLQVWIRSNAIHQRLFVQVSLFKWVGQIDSAWFLCEDIQMKIIKLSKLTTIGTHQTDCKRLCVTESQQECRASSDQLFTSFWFCDKREPIWKYFLFSKQYL